DVGHPDLAANIWSNPAPGSFGCDGDLHGCSFLDPSRSASCPPASVSRSGEVVPTTPHGTFVAGVIGAVTDNGLGIAGIAWHVSLMPVRVADCHNAANATAVANAIHYAVDAGAR